MKNLTLIVHADTEQALADFLRGLPQVSGFTFTQVEEHGSQDERNSELSARDLVVGYTPHARVDLILREKDVEAVLSALRESHLGIAGRSQYWVTSVEAGTL
jgi:nitrogen regulatory protein P-II 1